MIIVQFLIESITVSIAGGLIGIIVGVSIALLIPHIVGMSSVISPLPIIGSFLFSVIIGLVFGLYPAQKAAKLNPIEQHYTMSKGALPYVQASDLLLSYNTKL